MPLTADTDIPAAPQTGRAAAPPDHSPDVTGLWNLLLARFRDLSGSFDTFANDANADVRALGRIARQRKQPQANDYFAIGDLCAQLTLQAGQLSEAYAAKVIAAYARASQVSTAEIYAARRALINFAFWVIDIALQIDEYEALKVGALICERIRQLGAASGSPSDQERLQAAEQRIQQHLSRLTEFEHSSTDTHMVAERESRLLCDQGQMLLRQSQANEALVLFDRALQANQQNHAAWLWRAMALTDLGRFDDAITSYDKALVLDPSGASVWNSKGALLMELGRLDLALECFERALQSPTAASTVRAAFWLNKGKVLFMLKQYAAARDALTNSHQLDPSPESAAGIAACREQLGDLAPAQ